MNKINIIENSGGRIFGVSLKGGKKVNARFIGSSDKYIKLFDNNAKKTVKFAKTSVVSVKYNGAIVA